MEKVSHINTGFRKILEIPQMYNLKGFLFGGEKYRKSHAESLKVRPGDRLLDIGCGTANILKYLDEGVEYHGIDMEESYIKFCNENYPDKGSFYNEKVGDVLREDWSNYFDVINIHGLIHHLSDEHSLSLIKSAYKYLKPGGRAITVDTLYHEDQSRISRWFVSKDRGQNIRYPQEYLDLAKTYFGDVETKIITDHLNIPYSIYYMKMTK